MPKKSKQNPPDWKKFEIAVADFIRTLDPSAKVDHNVKLPDRHTGRNRQRDVWIQAMFGGHFPIKILVSCKRHKRELHEGDIDAFNGELLSSGAQKGVLYSYSGFNEAAIEKARALNICCCRLYQDQPADLPGSLIVDRQYVCRPRIALSVAGPLDAWGIANWDQLFELPTDAVAGKTVLDKLIDEYQLGEGESTAGIKATNPSSLFPADWQRTIRIDDPSDSKPSLFVKMDGKWVFFRSKLEANLLNGSYSITGNQFLGTQSLPEIDTQGTTPGTSWERIDGRPSDVGPHATTILTGPNVRQSLSGLRPKPVV